MTPSANTYDDFFMIKALEEACRAAKEGEVPIGAVVVDQTALVDALKMLSLDSMVTRSLEPDASCAVVLAQPLDSITIPLLEAAIVASAHNRKESTQDPAGHAEVLALRAAASRLNAWRLADCAIYVTLEPCVMCAGLMHQARIARCIWGASDPKAGALGSLYSIHADQRLNHRFEVTSGVLADESAALLKNFFATRRHKEKS